MTKILPGSILYRERAGKNPSKYSKYDVLAQRRLQSFSDYTQYPALYDRYANYMDVFAFREELVAEYEQFSRSFAKIRARDISRTVDEVYASGQFWPAPLIQLNPNFEPGGYVDDLVADGALDPECAKIFRIKRANDPGGEPIRLHRHQTDAIDIANRGESYVLTTGTGSGKSLAYFIPIVDNVLRRKRNGDACKGISAIVVYPMNALCNSQREELEKYLCLGYGEGREPVTFARYTGQESNEERERIAKNPPDILLTNYVMLELIMTRFLETDKAIREHAAGLQFLVLDELHTYRGRQGADVALLVRRVRERFNKRLICIGTSATMASEGAPENRNAVVADVASRLFGAPVDPGHVVSETLRRVTEADAPVSGPALRAAIEQGCPPPPHMVGFLTRNWRGTLSQPGWNASWGWKNAAANSCGFPVR